MLYEAVVLHAKANRPRAVLRQPVELSSNEPAPTATFSAPVVLDLEESRDQASDANSEA